MNEAELLRTHFTYDPATGGFKTRTVRRGSWPVGHTVGGFCMDGYVHIRFAGKYHKAHRLAWLYVFGVWPAVELDHRNGNRADNSIDNLRPASREHNMQNQRRARADNLTGLLGVTRKGTKFHARIGVSGALHHIGSFDTAEAAHKAYVEAKRELHPGGLL